MGIYCNKNSNKGCLLCVIENEYMLDQFINNLNSTYTHREKAFGNLMPFEKMTLDSFDFENVDTAWVLNDDGKMVAGMIATKSETINKIKYGLSYLKFRLLFHKDSTPNFIHRIIFR